MTTNKQKAIDGILSTVRKKLGKDSARRLSAGGSKSGITEVVPSGIPVLDHFVIGCGGYPVGRLTELYADEGAGKSSLGWKAIAECQKGGGVAALVETENGVSAERAALFGVDLDELILIEPDCMEDAIDALELVLKGMPTDGEGPNLLVWDSIAATPTRGEVKDGATGDAVVGDRARLLGRACRVIANEIARARCAAIFINQTREKVGVMFGDKYTTPGGKPVKFLASLRLQLLGGAAVKDGTGHVGKDVTAIAAKNKMAPPWRKCRLRLMYLDGWDTEWATFNLAKDLGVLGESVKRTAKGYAEARERLEACGWGSNMGAEVPKAAKATAAEIDDEEDE